LLIALHLADGGKAADGGLGVAVRQVGEVRGDTNRCTAIGQMPSTGGRGTGDLRPVVQYWPNLAVNRDQFGVGHPSDMIIALPMLPNDGYRLSEVRGTAAPMRNID
jgi:hypothetical protein